MKQAHLENWSLVGRVEPYTPPELWKYSLRGEVYNHPLFEDGEVVYTSSVQRVSDGKVITRNTEYTLGDVDPAYERLYPNAKQRVFGGNE